MTRVSLKEAYDNKDVIAQIYAIRDTAESAEDTAEQAVTTANTASDHVDALVPQVEGAVENANSASASAQASAQTVAGYENRLGAVEDATEDLAGDLNAVTLRVTTAEGQIVTIQGRVTAVETKNNQQDTAISALQTADAQNVKLTGANGIGTLAVLLTDNQDVYGNKRHHGLLSAVLYPVESLPRKTPASMGSGEWVAIYSWTISNVVRGISFSVYAKSDGRTAYYTASGNTSNGSIHSDGVWNGMDATLKLAYDTETGTVVLFCNSPRKNFLINGSGISNNDASLAVVTGDNTPVSEPIVGERYAWVVGVTE